APGADDVADDAVDWGALRDRHLSLRDRACDGDFDGAAAEKMQDAHAARPTVLVCCDELLEAALKPGRHHAPVGMPHSAEEVPQPRVAPDRPVLHQFTDDAFILVDAHCAFIIGFLGKQFANGAAIVATPPLKEKL